MRQVETIAITTPTPPTHGYPILRTSPIPNRSLASHAELRGPAFQYRPWLAASTLALHSVGLTTLPYQIWPGSETLTTACH